MDKMSKTFLIKYENNEKLTYIFVNKVPQNNYI